MDLNITLGQLEAIGQWYQKGGEGNAPAIFVSRHNKKVEVIGKDSCISWIYGIVLRALGYREVSISNIQKLERAFSSLIIAIGAESEKAASWPGVETRIREVVQKCSRLIVRLGVNSTSSAEARTRANDLIARYNKLDRENSDRFAHYSTRFELERLVPNNTFVRRIDELLRRGKLTVSAHIALTQEFIKTAPNDRKEFKIVELIEEYVDVCANEFAEFSVGFRKAGAEMVRRGILTDAEYRAAFHEFRELKGRDRTHQRALFLFSAELKKRKPQFGFHVVGGKDIEGRLNADECAGLIYEFVNLPIIEQMDFRFNKMALERIQQKFEKSVSKPAHSTTVSSPIRPVSSSPIDIPGKASPRSDTVNGSSSPASRSSADSHSSAEEVLRLFHLVSGTLGLGKHELLDELPASISENSGISREHLLVLLCADQMKSNKKGNDLVSLATQLKPHVDSFFFHERHLKHLTPRLSSSSDSNRASLKDSIEISERNKNFALSKIRESLQELAPIIENHFA